MTVKRSEIADQIDADLKEQAAKADAQGMTDVGVAILRARVVVRKYMTDQQRNDAPF